MLGLVRLHPEIVVGYARIVTITSDSLLEINEFRQSVGATWTFLSDVGREVVKDLDIQEYTDPRDAPAIPHTFVLKPGLVIHKVYNGYWYWGRPRPDELARDLRDVSAEIRPDWDIESPEWRRRWDEGDRDAFWPYGESMVHRFARQYGSTASEARELPAPPPAEMARLFRRRAQSERRGTTHRTDRSERVGAEDRQDAQREFGVVGLGRMGGNIALHALTMGYRVAGYDPRGAPAEFTGAGLVAASAIEDFASALRPPRRVFLYIPAGPAVDEVIGAVADALEPGDVILDGGNSYWGDSIRRHERLAARGIGFVDLGTSGGVEGAREGACFMAGGERETVSAVEPILRDLAEPGGYVYAGPSGSGHFVKLVHNGILYGMLEAIGEGISLLRGFPHPPEIADVLSCWSNGSVIRSFLIDVLETQFRELGGTEGVPAYVEDTGEVNWLVEDALHLGVPVPVIAQSVMQLLASRDPDDTWSKAVSMMRHGFGGHPLGPDEHVAEERDHGRVGPFVGTASR